jgi:lipoprotein NlpI
MRRLISVLIAALGLSLGGYALAQTSDELQQYCRDPHPEVRVLACTIIIDKGLDNREAMADAFTSRGSARAVQGDQDHAIEDFSRAIALSPGRIIVFGYRGAAYLAKSAYDNAIADFDHAIAGDGNYADAIYGRAGALRAKGDNDRAIADYTRVLALDPDYLEAVAFRGLAYRDKDELDLAIADFDTLIARNANDAQAFNLRGSTYRDKGDPDRAFADFDQAITLSPDDVGLIDNRGFAELMFGRFAEARRDFARALELQPAYPYGVLWLDLARRKSIQPEADELARNAAGVDLGRWPGPVLRLYGGQVTAEDVRADAASSPNPGIRQERSCEAAFYIGELELLDGNAGAAKNELQAAVATCPHSFMEYAGAARELRNLR